MSMAHITHSTTDNTESPLSTYHDQEAQQQTLKRCGWSKLNDHSSSIPLRSISVWLWSPIRLLTFSCPGASRDIFSAQPQFTPALWRVSLHGKYPIRMLVTSPPSSLFMVWLRSVGSEISFYCTATDFENLWRFWLCQQNIVCSDSVGQKLDQIGGKKYKETSRVLKWNLFLISGDSFANFGSANYKEWSIQGHIDAYLTTWTHCSNWMFLCLEFMEIT